MPCVSCGVWRAQTTYASRAKMATSRRIVSHSMSCIVAFHLVGILHLSMGGGMERPSRRTLLAAAATLAADAVVPDKAKAGILYDVFGIGPNPEKVRELKNRFYATEKYMEHNGGELRNNFARLQAIGLEMKEKGAYRNLSQEDRNKMLVELKDPIYRERNAYLKEFDSELITDLLVEYIENGLTTADQNLISIYERAGGSVDRIRQKGRAGVNAAAVENISSVMIYSLEGNLTPKYGEVRYGPIIFRSHEAPKDH